MAVVYSKSTDVVCATRTGWVAKILYHNPSDDSDGSSGMSYPINFPQPEFLSESVVDHTEYYRNDQDEIDSLSAQLQTLNYTYVEKLFYNPYADVYDQFYYAWVYEGPDAFQAERLSEKILLDIPAQTITIYKTIQVPNPAYNPEQVPPGLDIVLLNDNNRRTQWNYFTYDLVGIKSDGSYHDIPVSTPIAAVDFIFCGCGVCECECSDCCISIVELSQNLTNLFNQLM